MISKLSTIGKWIIAVIATVVIIGASFTGFHAFNARAHANAELQSRAQSPQSDSTEQSGPQSGDAPQSAEPTPAEITKPTPRLTSTQADKLVPKRHHSGTSTYGRMRSTPGTQKTL